MSDVTSPDSDVIRSQQERDLGHKLDHRRDKRHGPPAELMKPETHTRHRYLKDQSSQESGKKT